MDNSINKVAFGLQVIIGIGAKPAVGPFERLGLNKDIGGIQVSLTDDNFLGPKFYDQCYYFEN